MNKDPFAIWYYLSMVVSIATIAGYMIRIGSSVNIFVIAIILIAMYLGYATIIRGYRDKEKEIENLKKKLEEQKENETEQQETEFKQTIKIENLEEKLREKEIEKIVDKKLKEHNTEKKIIPIQKESMKEETNLNQN